jgi:hypothetical protein
VAEKCAATDQLATSFPGTKKVSDLPDVRLLISCIAKLNMESENFLFSEGAYRPRESESMQRNHIR